MSVKSVKGLEGRHPTDIAAGWPHRTAKFLGSHPRRPSAPRAQVHEGALVGSGALASGKAPGEELLRAKGARLHDLGHSFQLGVIAPELVVQTHVDVLSSPHLWEGRGSVEPGDGGPRGERCNSRPSDSVDAKSVSSVVHGRIS